MKAARARSSANKLFWNKMVGVLALWWFLKGEKDHQVRVMVPACPRARSGQPDLPESRNTLKMRSCLWALFLPARHLATLLPVHGAGSALWSCCSFRPKALVKPIRNNKSISRLLFLEDRTRPGRSAAEAMAMSNY